MEKNINKRMKMSTPTYFAKKWNNAGKLDCFCQTGVLSPQDFNASNVCNSAAFASQEKLF